MTCGPILANRLITKASLAALIVIAVAEPPNVTWLTHLCSMTPHGRLLNVDTGKFLLSLSILSLSL
jgi:hypothetical protein